MIKAVNDCRPVGRYLAILADVKIVLDLSNLGLVVKVYQEETLPKYEKALAEWTEKHNKEIAELEASLDKAKKELAAHYAATKIVPEQYRTAEALGHIYAVMRSSNYTIPQAIENYDQKIRQQIEAERLRVQRAAYEEQRRAADAAEREADAAEARYRSESVENSAKQDYYWSSDCMQRRNMRNGKYRVFRKCEGCRMAPYCSSYR